MKINLSVASLLVTLSLAGAHQAPAQYISPGDVPSGQRIGWSSSAPLCQTLPGAAMSFINYSAPSFVTFAPKAYGTIGLICNMSGITNGLTPASINALAFTFSNPNAVHGCTAEIQIVDRTTATPVGHWATDDFTNYEGVWVVDLWGLQLSEKHTYDVEFYLHRTQSAASSNSCNPAAYAGFLEQLSVIQ